MLLPPPLVVFCVMIMRGNCTIGAGVVRRWRNFESMPWVLKYWMWPEPPYQGIFSTRGPYPRTLGSQRCRRG
eukprot:5059367-Pyramimonas_sp.AAC.1